MKRWKLYSFILAAAALFAVNVYLTVTDNSKVARTAFVEEWAAVKKQDIIETFETKGVIKPKEEFPVYYDSENKEFQKFLVREGDAVSAGTPLFEYITPELDTLRANIEAEKSQIAGEIAGIDEYISKLESYQQTIPESSSSTVNKKELEEQLDIENASADVISSSIEQEIYKQELEKSRLEEQTKKFDAQLSNMAASGAATVASEAEGVVKYVDQNLGDPIITIASAQSAVEGVLNEKQLRKAKPGMKIKITSPDLKKPLNGTLEQVNTNPTEEPTVKKESTYLYNAVMEKESNKLMKGSKVGVTVITRETKGVPAVPESAVLQKKEKRFLYQLTSKGHMNKQSIDKGLGFAGKLEVKSGIKPGDVVVRFPDSDMPSRSLFITPLDTGEVRKTALEKIPGREKIRYLLIGVLEQ